MKVVAKSIELICKHGKVIYDRIIVYVDLGITLAYF
jgi:hypothetical protein